MGGEGYAVFVAGGTGGHINSAIALGEVFEEFNYTVEYISGRRYLDFKLYQGKKCFHVPSYPLVGKDVWVLFKSIIFNSVIFFIMVHRFLWRRPRFVFGAGGYVCGPTLLAAYIIGIPVFVLEQNSVMGLTNKVLSQVSKVTFTCFDRVKGLHNVKKSKNYGNPLRKEFFTWNFAMKSKCDELRVLIFGGSLGAQDINDMVKSLLKEYSLDIKVSLMHQTGRNRAFEPLSEGVRYTQVEYLDDIMSEYQKADMVICRGGASTIAELRLVGKPAIIIPIRFHGDQHQVHNAQALKKEAKFTVYIEPVDELSANKCEKLQKIIQQEYIRMNQYAHGKQNASKKQVENSSFVIAKEVLANV